MLKLNNLYGRLKKINLIKIIKYLDEPRNSMAQIIKLKPIPSKENELNTICKCIYF